MTPPSAFVSLIQDAAPGGVGAGPSVHELWGLLEAELRAGLAVYWDTAGQVLQGSGIRLAPPGEEDFSLKRNFFSTLFLYAYWRVALPPPRRTLYVAVNQCLRGMVTGCDNLLDDEYKATLETDLPPGVLNVITSSDHAIGSQLVADRRVDVVSFTGSTVTGKAVMAGKCRWPGTAPWTLVLESTRRTGTGLTRAPTASPGQRGQPSVALRPAPALKTFLTALRILGMSGTSS